MRIPVRPDRKIDHPESTVMNVVAWLTKFQGQVATAMIVRMKQPRRILIHRGQRAAMSMPVEMPLSTMHSASCEARKLRPEKKVPALAAGVKETACM